VRLTVSDLRRARAFYEEVLGLVARDVDGNRASFGASPSGEPLVEVLADASAAPLDRRATGLYHLAILLPSRRDLAHALLRLARSRWPLDGASDHLVSEALYLSDPDGNGIELYRDRPREQWTYDQGALRMSTLPLDLEGVARAALDGQGAAAGERPAAAGLAGGLSSLPAPPATVPAGTVIGHVHLQVAELALTEAFYAGALGFDVMVRTYTGALFVSAGGYHHHLGLNTWHSAGGPRPAPGAVGLRSFDVVAPDQLELERILARLQAAGHTPLGGPGDDMPPGAFGVRDPSGNLVVLRSA